VRAALYVRVSAQEQAHGFSPGTQREDVGAWAEREGWDVVATFEDLGESATSLDRPAFQEMVAAADARNFDLLLVKKRDRNARDIADATQTDKWLATRGVRVWSLEEPWTNGDDPQSYLQRGQAYLQADYYSRDLSVKVARGYQARRDRGLTSGRPPLGYRQPDPMQPIVIDEAEALHVRWLFDVYNGGGVSLSKLAVALNQRELRTRPFTASAVQSILENPTYAGYVTYRDEIVGEGQHEALVEPALWHRVQQVRESRRHGSQPRGPKSRPYMLSGVGLHDECGTGLWGQTNRDRIYYRCPLQAKGIPHKCERTVGRAEPIDADLARLIETFDQPDEWSALIAEFISEGREFTDLGAERTRLERKIERAQRALLDGLVGESQARSTIRETRIELAELGEHTDSAPSPEPRIITSLRENWHGFTDGQRREAVSTIFAEVQVDLLRGKIGDFTAHDEFVSMMAVAEGR
jgi:DNA invertase Pin-like site-specific DNA recombinase